MEFETAKRLHDVLSACDELQAFAAGRSRARFLEDRGLQFVVWKLIEIVGEAPNGVRRPEPEAGPRGIIGTSRPASCAMLISSQPGKERGQAPSL